MPSNLLHDYLVREEAGLRSHKADAYRVDPNYDVSYMQTAQKMNDVQARYHLDDAIATRKAATDTWTQATARFPSNRTGDGERFGSFMTGTMPPQVRRDVKGRRSHASWDPTYSETGTPLYDRTYLQSKDKQINGIFRYQVDESVDALAASSGKDSVLRGLPKVPSDLDRSIFSSYQLSAYLNGPGLPGPTGVDNDSDLVRRTVSSEKESPIRAYEKAQGLQWDPREITLYDRPAKFYYEIFQPHTLKDKGVGLVKGAIPDYQNMTQPPIVHQFREPAGWVFPFARNSRREAIKPVVPQRDVPQFEYGNEGKPM